MPAPHPAALEEKALLAQCEERRGRGSGPGGQHRNKVETRIDLVHRPTGIAVRAGERRSQGENRSVAVRRLRLALAVGVRLPRGEAGPSALWRSRCLDGRVACNPRHADFPALVAEALDVLAAEGWEPRPAAERLGCTPTQLVRLLGDHPPALAALNARRREGGARPLK